MGHHQWVRGWARGVVRYVGQLLKGYGLWAEDAVEEETWRLRSECGGYEDAKDAMGANAVCRAKGGHCHCVDGCRSNSVAERGGATEPTLLLL